MTEPDSDFSNEKEKRREKLKTKKTNTNNHIDDEDTTKKNLAKKELKKIKQSYLDEEWEDWDKYYNH